MSSTLNELLIYFCLGFLNGFSLYFRQQITEMILELIGHWGAQLCVSGVVHSGPSQRESPHGQEGTHSLNWKM